MFIFLAGIVILWLAIWAIDLFLNRHPLSEYEIRALAMKYRRRRAIGKFDFSIHQVSANPEEKKAMSADGEFVDCEWPYRSAPARVAALLKYKKHEWIVVGFIRNETLIKLWWNKGPDGTKVWLFLQEHHLDQVIEMIKPDTVVILHNHPNPNPSLYRMNLPSAADLRHAGIYGKRLLGDEVNLLEFICERGAPHLYFACFSDRVEPLAPIIDDVRAKNGRGLFGNYELRKALKNKIHCDSIPGGDLEASPVKQAA